MNYIGSKRKLLQFISESIKKHYKKQEAGVFCDAFAGTGVVSESFKRDSFQVIANDLQAYSVVRLKHILLNNKEPDFKSLNNHLRQPLNGKKVCQLLNELETIKGFVYTNYCLGGTEGQEWERQYFSDANGQRCDAIRTKIGQWQAKGLLTDGEFNYLLAALLENVDARANTASVYGAFLKHLKKSAQKPIEIKPLAVTFSEKEHFVYQLAAENLLKQSHVKGDILYLDPPYNQRQYAANYHVLESIALWDNPVLKGKTGLRDWSAQKSAWCSRSTVGDVLKETLINAQFPIIALSYNDEGLLSLKEIEMMMKKIGKYTLHKKRYTRFKADKTASRNHLRDFTYEHLHILEK